MLPSGLPDYLSVPQVLDNQIVAVAPKGYNVAPSAAAPGEISFCGRRRERPDEVGVAGARCFNEDGMPGDAANGVTSNLGRVLGEMRHVLESPERQSLSRSRAAAASGAAPC